MEGGVSSAVLHEKRLYRQMGNLSLGWKFGNVRTMDVVYLLLPRTKWWWQTNFQCSNTDKKLLYICTSSKSGETNFVNWNKIVCELVLYTVLLVHLKLNNSSYSICIVLISYSLLGSKNISQPLRGECPFKKFSTPRTIVSKSYSTAGQEGKSANHLAEQTKI